MVFPIDILLYYTLSNILFFVNADSASVSLLVIVVDTNPSQRIVRQNPDNLSQCLDAIVAFGNAHLMQKAQNKLAVISCHHHATYVERCPSLIYVEGFVSISLQRFPVSHAGQATRNSSSRWAI